ncbi:MAG: SRPBCC domain-containing protein [Myxococcota bacterium]
MSNDDRKKNLGPNARAVRKEVVVTAPLAEVWRSWTTSKGIKGFLGVDSEIELEIAGAFELYFAGDAPEGQRGGETCQVLSYLPQRMLSFSWNAPPNFGDLRGKHTWVVIEFQELDEEKVEVRLTHLGWGQGDDWDKLYDYFDRAWGGLLGALAARFAGG